MADFGDYEFEGGFPTEETVRRAYDDADLVRAITAYRFFYPSVSALRICKGDAEAGAKRCRESTPPSPLPPLRRGERVLRFQPAPPASEAPTRTGRRCSN